MDGLQAGFGATRQRIAGLTRAVSDALGETRSTLESLAQLEGGARAVEKLVDAVAMIAVQTSMLAVTRRGPK